MIAADWFSRLGFDTGRFGFLLRTGLAVCVAVGVAWLVGLQHPQWAGMTVWAASLPVRGQLLAKGLARLSGTVLGSVVGVALVYLASGQIGVLVLGLSLWIAICVFVGHLVRSFITYGCMLAGYSAALVALVDTAHPDQILALGGDRMLTALIGVLIAILVSWYFARASASGAEEGELCDLSAEVLRHLQIALSGGPDASVRRRHELISRMAHLDAKLEMRGLGSKLAQQQARRIRQLLPPLVSVLLWRRPLQDEIQLGRLNEALNRAIRVMETEREVDACQQALAEVTELCADDEQLHHLNTHLSTLHLAWAAAMGTVGRGEMQLGDSRLILHRDWVGARQSSLRAVTLMLTVGAIWLLSGEPIGAYMLLGTAIFTSLFSTFDSPALVMRSVFAGQVLGATGALACRWLVWPSATEEWQLILMIFPFVLLGVVILSHRRMTVAGFDYNMILLLLLQPHLPLQGEFSQSVMTALAVASAPLIAMLGYLFIYPVDARRRIEALKRVMLHELSDMARAQVVIAQREVWRARIYHRLLHLVRWSDLVGNRLFPAAEWGVTLLRLELATQSLHRLLQDGGMSEGEARAARLALNRIARLEREPQRVGPALSAVSRRLDTGSRRADIELLIAAAESVSSDLSLFQRKGPVAGRR